MQTDAAARPSLHVEFNYLIHQRDRSQVMAIEEASFANTRPPSWFNNQSSTNIWLAHHGDVVVGYMGYEDTPKGRRITVLAVHPDYRKRGVGRQLVEHARRNKKVATCVIVRESNLDAQLFFRSLKFIYTPPTHTSYFEDTGEDGYFMTRPKPAKGG